MFGFSQKVAAIAAGSLIVTGAIGIKPAQAVTFFSFEVELAEVLGGTEPAMGDTFTGTFSFEETAGFMDGGVELFDLTSFEFDFLGTSFDIGSDSRVASLSGFPTVAFDAASGEILGVDFFTEPFLPTTSISIVPEDLIGVVQDSEFEFTTTDVSGSGLVTYTQIEDPSASVPEPATVLALVVVGAGGLVIRKQHA